MNTLTLWTGRRDPFAEFDTLVRHAFAPAVKPAQVSTFRPAAEVNRDGDDAVIRLELPGVTLDDITVELDRGRLVVHGERRDERGEQTRGTSLREVRYGSFHRSFGLPSHVTADAVSAEYDAGVLSVRISGAYAGSSAQRIAITPRTEAAEITEVEAAA